MGAANPTTIEMGTGIIITRHAISGNQKRSKEEKCKPKLAFV